MRTEIEEALKRAYVEFFKLHDLNAEISSMRMQHKDELEALAEWERQYAARDQQ